MVGHKTPKKGASALGRALKNDRFGTKGQINTEGRFVAVHTTDIDAKAERAKKMQSVTQMTDFEEFYYNADMAEKEFAAERQNAVVLTNTSFQVVVDEPTEDQIREEKQHWNSLTIPRRPAWDKTTTPEELHAKESQYFLEWRRGLVKLEENKHLLLTPFEKNIEVWKQLWRVCERCDVIIQIVDARNPLLFRCPDLEKYIKELNPLKQNLLLVNKADLLTEAQREAWAKCFKDNGLEFVYFSANFEQLKLEESLAKKSELMNSEPLSEFEELELHERMIAAKLRLLKKKKEKKSSSDKSDEDSGSESESDEAQNNEQGEQIVESQKQEDLSEKIQSSENVEPPKQSGNPLTKIYTREELIQHLKHKYKPLDPERKLQVGMVGYPNVGKSSTINVLVGSKKVAVGPTPGKTKHFQTILLEENICLCDCPGLVFPTFLSTKADMVCNGLLSIHQLQAHAPPVSLVCKRIPKRILEQVYGIVLPKPGEYEDPNRPPTAEELLQAYAFNRGWMTVHGAPNESIAARVVLKDYMMGKLCYVFPPPEINRKDWDGVGLHSLDIKEPEEKKKPVQPSNQPEYITEATSQDRSHKTKRKKKANRKHEEPTIKPSKSNNPYEQQANVVAHTKGKFAQSGFTRTQFTHNVTPVRRTNKAEVVLVTKPTEM